MLLIQCRKFFEGFEAVFFVLLLIGFQVAMKNPAMFSHPAKRDLALL
jgi:hypothetical protein